MPTREEIERVNRAAYETIRRVDRMQLYSATEPEPVMTIRMSDAELVAEEMARPTLTRNQRDRLWLEQRDADWKHERECEERRERGRQDRAGHARVTVADQRIASLGRKVARIDDQLLEVTQNTGTCIDALESELDRRLSQVTALERKVAELQAKIGEDRAGRGTRGTSFDPPSLRMVQ